MTFWVKFVIYFVNFFTFRDIWRLKKLLFTWFSALFSQIQAFLVYFNSILFNFLQWVQNVKNFKFNLYASQNENNSKKTRCTLKTFFCLKYSRKKDNKVKCDSYLIKSSCVWTLSRICVTRRKSNNNDTLHWRPSNLVLRHLKSERITERRFQAAALAHRTCVKWTIWISAQKWERNNFGESRNLNLEYLWGILRTSLFFRSFLGSFLGTFWCIFITFLTEK